MARFENGVRSVGLACLWLTASSAEAVAPRAYVSVAGNDGNLCSNPLTPCRTFTGAIAQTTPGGEVVVLDSGTFGGGTISQAVTINAPAGIAALAATPITIAAGANDEVTLRGLTFVSPTPGAGTALTFSGGAALNVENCVFHGWLIGINFASAGELHVTDTTLRDNSGSGIGLGATSGTIQAFIQRTRLLRNTFGLYVGSRASATISDSVAAGNQEGLYATSGDSSLSELNVENCRVSNNTEWGVAANGGVAGTGYGTIRISNSTVTGNADVGLYKRGTSVVLSRGNNTIEGNGTNTVGVTAFTAR